MSAPEPAAKRKKVVGSKYSLTEDAPGAKWTRFPIRVRAHRNPLSDNEDYHPTKPSDVDWDAMFPERADKRVEIVDIGCAYGGLLCKLSPLFPDVLMLGIEIRDKVASFAQSRVKRLRSGQVTEGDGVALSNVTHHFRNTWFTQGNAMKYLPNYFEQGQLKRIFFCYPDPHFKKKNVRRRIIQEILLAEYAYVLADGGLLYTVTDVKDLADWMQGHLDSSPLFERLTEAETSADPYINYVKDSSEDAVRTEKQNLSKYFSIHRKKRTPPL
ncbi:tRNA (guanine-N(7)-)-methyltransferase [Diplonema papillatum]|nr:tRNA (guanine-N(7)-)-methyltransferase [Diplonema papillatum]